VGSARLPTGHHLVAFGDLIFDRAVRVWEGSPVSRYERFHRIDTPQLAVAERPVEHHPGIQNLVRERLVAGAKQLGEPPREFLVAL
jgi:hypothetical protein